MSYAARYRNRGVVGVGLGGLEAEYPPEPFAPVVRSRAESSDSAPCRTPARRRARPRCAARSTPSARIGSATGSGRRRPGPVREIADRGVVLDVCPISNVRTRTVDTLADHPLPQLWPPARLLDHHRRPRDVLHRSLARREAAVTLGLVPEDFYAAGIEGALCDEETKTRLSDIGAAFDWPSVRPLR